MSDNDLPGFALRLEQAAAALSGPAMRRVIDRVGVEAKRDGSQVAGRSLGGDGKFSGWPRVSLGVKYTVHPDGMGLTLHREPRSAGPFRVAEDGRNQGNASGFSGPGVNRKTGASTLTKSGRLRKSKSPGGRRWNGRTRGKGVWTATESTMKTTALRKVPQVVGDELLGLVTKG